MNKNIGIIIGVVALILIGGGIYSSKNQKDTVAINETENNSVVELKNESGIKKDEVNMAKVGSYEVYAPEKITLASSEHSVVLFFRAGWCPSCRAIDADIKSNLSKIPSDLTILDVDYDNSSPLKKKYGVTYQHTFVQVDKDGNLIKKWSGSPTLSALISEIK